MTLPLLGRTPLDSETQEAYETQATDFLEEAQQYRTPLLNLSQKLAGCPAEGRGVFEQVVLNCHDAIQVNGFDAQKWGYYRFYLLGSLRERFPSAKPAPALKPGPKPKAKVK